MAALAFRPLHCFADLSSRAQHDITSHLRPLRLVFHRLGDNYRVLLAGMTPALRADPGGLIQNIAVVHANPEGASKAE
ncbi:hypothetical protein D3C76_1567810 [compost metagenome]